MNGRKVVGPNGNSIFLPAAGDRIGSDLDIAGSNGYFWSSSAYDSYDYSYYLNFYSGLYDLFSNLRYNGFTVRPVSE